MKFWVDLEGLEKLIRELVRDHLLGDDLRIVSTRQEGEFGGLTYFLVKLRKGQVRRLLPVATAKILEERYCREQ